MITVVTLSRTGRPFVWRWDRNLTLQNRTEAIPFSWFSLKIPRTASSSANIQYLIWENSQHFSSAVFILQQTADKHQESNNQKDKQELSNRSHTKMNIPSITCIIRVPQPISTFWLVWGIFLRASTWCKICGSRSSFKWTPKLKHYQAAAAKLQSWWSLHTNPAHY